MNNIPKIIHQIWIGDASKAPTKFMATWKDMHTQPPLDFEYIFWNEQEIERRSETNPNFKSVLSRISHRVSEMEEINGKADILRWVILHEYGGIFCDADSICVKPIDDVLLNNVAFAGYENEHVRGAGWSNNFPEIFSHKHPLIALGCIGFPPHHPIVKEAVSWIEKNPVSNMMTRQRAWYSVGPGLITRIYYSNEEKYKKKLTICPSYYFLPLHYSGIEYKGHDKVYAYQEWGSTKQSYATMNNIDLPSQLRDPPPTSAVSILIPSYNSKAIHLKECCESIRQQQGHYWIDLVCIDDGSDKLHATILKRILDQIQNTTRWIRVHHHVNEENMGICRTLAKGVELCPSDNELVFRMDTDDIMMPNRIAKQIEYMKRNPDVMLSGTQVHLFDEKTASILQTTNHPTVQWNDYKMGRGTNQPHWLANHPTYCFRRHAVLEVGNYNTNIHSVCEDFDLILRIMKRYGSIHNLPDALLYYRVHADQITGKLRERESSMKWSQVRNEIMRYYMTTDSLENYQSIVT